MGPKPQAEVSPKISRKAVSRNVTVIPKVAFKEEESKVEVKVCVCGYLITFNVQLMYFVGFIIGKGINLLSGNLITMCILPLRQCVCVFH